jgi:phenylacetate-CoA ligase
MQWLKLADETRSPEARAQAVTNSLPRVIAAALRAPGWQAHLGKVDPDNIRDRAALASLPVLRKSDLAALQKAQAPFGGLSLRGPGGFARLFSSPGPIF